MTQPIPRSQSAVAERLAEIVGERQSFRYGGDEFAILLADKSRSESRITAVHLLKAGESLVRGDESIAATISQVSANFPADPDHAEALLSPAVMSLNCAQ